MSMEICEQDEKLLLQFQRERGILTETLYNYKSAIYIYTTLHEMDMYELIEEAETEEEQGIRWKHRKLKQKLLEFRTYLYETLTITTAKLYLTLIKTFYKHYEIEIHDLPSISEKHAKKNPPLLYDDLITKKEIQKTLAISDPKTRAIILFMCSSGCARTETHNITIQDFVDSLQEYIIKNDIYEIIKELGDRNDIVPTFKLKRQKTNQYYYTFCTPEATQSIFSYLKQRKDTLEPDSKLFKFDKKYLSNKFRYMSEIICEFDKVGGHNKFRTHMLRKFHASNLAKGKHPLTFEEIDMLQGRKKTGSRPSYFFDDPRHLKKKYIANMEQVTINQEIDTLTLESPEVLEIKKENRKLKENYEKMKEETKKEIMEMLEELGL